MRYLILITALLSVETVADMYTVHNPDGSTDTISRGGDGSYTVYSGNLDHAGNGYSTNTYSQFNSASGKQTSASGPLLPGTQTDSTPGPDYAPGIYQYSRGQ
jgi:hypothetical protein